MEVSLSAAKSRILMFVFAMCVCVCLATHRQTHTTVTGEQKVLNNGEWEKQRDALIAAVHPK